MGRGGKTKPASKCSLILHQRKEGGRHEDLIKNIRRRVVRIISRHRSKHSLYINSDNPHNNPMKQVLLSLFYCGRDQGKERWSHLPGVTQPDSSRTKIWTQADGLRHLYNLLERHGAGIWTCIPLSPEASFLIAGEFCLPVLPAPASSQEPEEEVWLEPQLWVSGL